MAAPEATETVVDEPTAAGKTTPEDIARDEIITSLSKAVEIAADIERKTREKTPDNLGDFLDEWSEVSLGILYIPFLYFFAINLFIFLYLKMFLLIFFKGTRFT